MKSQVKYFLPTQLPLLAFFLTMPIQNLTAQNKQKFKTLHRVIQNADSIKLISHYTAIHNLRLRDSLIRSTVDSADYLLWKKDAYQYFIDKKINEKVIKESATLHPNSIHELKRIITRNSKNENACLPECGWEYHSIIIYTKQKQLFIAISFPCRTVSSSNELNIITSDFDWQKFDELKDFFIKNGIKLFWDVKHI